MSNQKIALLTILAALAFSFLAPAADTLFPVTMQSHVVTAVSIPATPTDVYTSSVWLKSIEFIPQSTSSPTCTVQDKSGTPVIAYNAIQLSPNHSYRDERSDTSPLFMNGGITWSCSDTTVKAQMIVKY